MLSVCLWQQCANEADYADVVFEVPVLFLFLAVSSYSKADVCALGWEGDLPPSCLQKNEWCLSTNCDWSVSICCATAISGISGQLMSNCNTSYNSMQLGSVLVPSDTEGLETQNMTLLSLLQEILLCSSSARYWNVAGQILSAGGLAWLETWPLYTLPLGVKTIWGLAVTPNIFSLACVLAHPSVPCVGSRFPRLCVCRLWHLKRTAQGMEQH